MKLPFGFELRRETAQPKYVVCGKSIKLAAPTLKRYRDALAILALGSESERQIEATSVEQYAMIAAERERAKIELYERRCLELVSEPDGHKLLALYKAVFEGVPEMATAEDVMNAPSWQLAAGVLHFFSMHRLEYARALNFRA
jgi:hypothetical protein